MYLEIVAFVCKQFFVLRRVFSNEQGGETVTMKNTLSLAKFFHFVYAKRKQKC